ncbi:hypothetical protein BT93_E1527 [Corymbia citriodora subsp. variegata]|nr:hypothetical protein BT93_E1527 [Corymbia citriodora subsp. variegata]
MQSSTGWETMPKILKFGERSTQKVKSPLAGGHISVRTTSQLG